MFIDIVEAEIPVTLFSNPAPLLTSIFRVRDC